MARFDFMSSGMPFANFISLTDPSGPPSPLAPLSDTTITIVFSRCPDSSRVIQQPPDVVVGVRQETPRTPRHPGEQPLLLIGQGVP